MKPKAREWMIEMKMSRMIARETTYLYTVYRIYLGLYIIMIITLESR